MPEYTLPPTITGVPPETWEQILQILNQFGLTVADLSSMGITAYEGAGGLKEYLTNSGWELKEVWDLKEMWFYTGAGDATQSNALVQYVANEVTIAGTAGSEYVKHFTYGESTLGKVKKGIIFGTVFALLVSTLDPTLITDTLKGRLESVIDLFADENDDVPVIVGADGKTYYHEEMIDALRDVLINEGVYSSGEESLIDIESDWAHIVRPFYRRVISPIYTKVGSAYRYLYLFDDITMTNSSYGSCIGIVSDNDYGDLYAVCSPYDNGDNVKFVIGGNNTLMRFRSAGAYYYDSETASYSSEVSLSGNAYDVTYNSETKRVYRFNWNALTNPLTGTSAYTIQPNSVTEQEIFKAMLWGDYEGGSGVEGITVDDDLITAGIGDNTVSLATVFPEFAEDYITTINPTDEDLGAHDNWYPVSTYNNDVWEDGITEQQNQTAPDGEVSPDMQTAIADAIKEILEDYYRDPTDPTIINWPQIPVGDSGDTPPENPDLISGSSNGLWAIYNPTITEVQDFGAWLWSSNILDQITRMFNSPIDAVIGFHMIYCTPVTGSSKTIKAGYLDSPVSAKEVTNQYVDIDCGTVTISEYYRNALDYDNTRISLFLPFIGIVPLDTNTVMGSQLSILYRVDVLTGTCLAQVKVIKENSEAVLYTFQGNCSVQVPLTATTYTGMVGALLSGISAGASIMTGNIVGAVSAGLEGAMRAGTGLSGVRQSGTIGANAGALGIRIPYVIITHPVSAMSDGFNTLEGLPSNELVNLSSVSGFTRVTFVHLENIPASMPEIEEIQTLLETGVIF